MMTKMMVGDDGDDVAVDGADGNVIEDDDKVMTKTKP